MDPAEITATVNAACRLLDLDPRGHTVLKFTNNAVLRLPRSGVVLRIAGSAAVGERARRVVHVARLLEQHGVPAVRLFQPSGQPDDQPLMIRGHEVTVWHDVRPVRDPVPDDLAALLQAVHAVPLQAPAAPVVPARRGRSRRRPSVPGQNTGPMPSAAASSPSLVRWGPVAGIRRRIASAGQLPLDDLAFLQAETDAVALDLAALNDLESLLPAGLIHGDSFLGNVIVGENGPVLCDFDSTCWGPREWDLTPIAVGALRFDYGGDLAARFAQAYGKDVQSWPGFPVLRRLRELQLVTSVLPVLAANPGLHPQWRFRVDSLRRGDAAARWSTYGKVAA
ncbi:aminoglycoside phosphotransferase family protein [Kineosporia sp. NBRC 101731]|uniref:aminoglycoside phosphotransferase family protein n=1 Tax=Kineosporia sp. NBRC 101731 TaxID=3032199 RepID=UPI002553473B|nr:aminoglycoside phosphotransferase family protein [Kineosporia sp. NBRC 101731]